MAQRILFIPWPRHESAEQTAKCERWKQVADTKNRLAELAEACGLQPGAHQIRPKDFVVAHFTGSPLDVFSTDDFSFYFDGQVYIRGHNNAGLDYLMEREDGRGPRLPYSAVCDRLIKSGLETFFTGKIKFWNCESGISVRRGTESFPSFAKLCADCLRGKGFDACQFFGYTGSVTSYPTLPSDRDGMADALFAQVDREYAERAAGRQLDPQYIGALAGQVDRAFHRYAQRNADLYTKNVQPDPTSPRPDGTYKRASIRRVQV